MKVLYTSHVAGDRPTFGQVIYETTHDSVEKFFCEENQLEYPHKPDKWTTVNEYGVFITCLPECVESWVRIIDPPASADPWTISPQTVHAARIGARWTQEKLARAAGVSTMTIVRLESAAGERRGTTMVKVVEALRSAGISI